MDTLLPSRIHSIKTTPVNRGSVEFATQLTGRVAEVAIDYGDGKSEAMKLPDTAFSELLLSEHKFEKGAFVVSVTIRDKSRKILDKKKLLWGQS